MKLEVGMYVRLKNDAENIVIINKITNVFETTILTENDGSIYQGEYTKENVIKASYNIIDLIEVGDYVNDKKIIGVGCLTNGPREGTKVIDYYITPSAVSYLENEDIKTVITHEQMEQMAYKVGE